MKSLSRRVYKGSQVNMGHPYVIIKDKDLEFLLNDPKIENEENKFGIEPKDKALKENALVETCEQNEENEVVIIEKERIEAEEFLRRAKEEANILLQEAEKKGFESGFELGFEKGNFEGASQYEKLTKEAEDLFVDLQEQYKNLLVKAEDEIVRLSIEIAKKVIGIELKTNPNLIVALTREALSRTLQQEGILVKVSKEDAQILSNHLELLGEGRTGDINIEESLILKQGECLIQTDYGIVDGSLEKKMGIIEEALLEELKKEKSVEIS